MCVFHQQQSRASFYINFWWPTLFIFFSPFDFLLQAHTSATAFTKDRILKEHDYHQTFYERYCEITIFIKWSFRNNLYQSHPPAVTLNNVKSEEKKKLTWAPYPYATFSATCMKSTVIKWVYYYKRNRARKIQKIQVWCIIKSTELFPPSMPHKKNLCYNSIDVH